MDLTPQQKAEAQRLFEALQGPFLDEARRLAELLASKADAQLLGKTEFDVAMPSTGLVPPFCRPLWRSEKKGYQGSSMTCPHCQADARCKGFRRRTALTLLGTIRFGRHYYYCRTCGRGVCPLDDTLGLSAADLTPAADEVLCVAGVQDSFATAAHKVLARLCGLRVSESTVERTTEAAGTRVATAQAAARPSDRRRRGTGTTMPTARRWRMCRSMPPGSANKVRGERRPTVAWLTSA